MLLDRIVSDHDKATGNRFQWTPPSIRHSTVMACVGALGMYAVMGSPLAEMARSEAGGDKACLIKGNVSHRGERIYHVPGGEFYGRTMINPLKGERWFCSESDARAAGWRRSRR